MKKTLEKGLQWRVENGYQIRIWKDPWIKNLSSFKPTQTGRELDEDTRVRKLIDEDRH